MIGTTVLLGGLALLFLVSGAWPLTLFFAATIVYGWLTWAANPQQRRSGRS